MEAKLASSMLEEDSQLNFYWIGQNLHVYEQELFLHCCQLSAIYRVAK